ncbi:MAG: bacillolysin, partial [Acidobacteria bacterium]|nr:bacillolysin [Acidobacteriota bacterium]
ITARQSLASAALAACALVYSSSAGAATELRADRTLQSLTGTHVHYQQFIDGLPVVGGEQLEKIAPDGTPRITYQHLSREPLDRGRTAAALAAPAGDAAAVYLDINGTATLAWKTRVEEQPFQPYAVYTDAVTGAVLRRDPLFWNATAHVFSVNPVAKGNSASLRDENNSSAAVPASDYSTVELLDLQPSGMLRGPNVSIVDDQLPATEHADASQPLIFERSQPQFEEVNAYFHIDRSQRYLQSLGYDGPRRIVGYSIPVDPHAAGGQDNSFYIQSTVAGRGELFFGDGGTDDAEDPDILLHELGHAIEDWIAPGAFGGSSAGEARALGEGFGDYWAFSQSYAQTAQSGRDPFCIADWDARCDGDNSSEQCGYPAGSDCLRRVDSSKTMADFLHNTQSGTEHKNGEIWSSALREIFMNLVAAQGVAAGSRAADTIVIEAHFGLSPLPTFATMARRMVDADRLLYAGAHVSAICSAVVQRGILGAADCGSFPHDEWSYVQSDDHGLSIPDANPAGITSTIIVDDARPIQQLAVQIDVRHPSRGDLRIVLVAPDGTQVVLLEPSLDRGADIRGKFGVDIASAQPLDVLFGKSAQGTWKLVVIDTLARDAGTLASWNLVLKLGGDAVAESRPSDPYRLVVPVAGHVSGAAGSTFMTDLRLFNPDSQPVTVSVIFTPSGADGTTTFASTKVVVEAHQVVEFEDAIAQLFQSTGIGQLEIGSESPALIATSRTYTRATGGGTYGQFVPATPAERAVHAGDAAVYIPGLEVTILRRANVGVAEVGGHAGTATIRLCSSTGNVVSTTSYAIAPFSHFQFALTSPDPGYLAQVTVSGDAAIVAYGSVIDNTSNDGIFMPAQPAPESADSYVLPVIRADGANGTQWRSDLGISGIASNGSSVDFNALFVDGQSGTRASHTFPGPGTLHSYVIRDVAGQSFGRETAIGLLRIDLPPGVIATSRITATNSSGLTYGQYVPPVSTGFANVLQGLQSADILNAESSADFRTNAGLANLGGFTARVRLIVYDASGVERGRTAVSVEPLQLVQLPISSFVSGTLVNGRLHIDILEASRGVLAYASTVDNVTGDPVYMLAK